MFYNIINGMIFFVLHIFLGLNIFLKIPGEKGKFFGKFGKEKSVLDMSKMKNGQGKSLKNLPFAPKCSENFVGQK
jgi:hypothetical protein